MKIVRSAYDVDGILLHFIASFIDFAESFLSAEEFEKWPQAPEEWTSWNPVPNKEFSKVWEYINRDPELFWKWLPVHPNLDTASDCITPDLYLTSIPCEPSLRAFNLELHYFPEKPIIKSSHDNKHSLVDHYGITHMIEDKFENWVQINQFSGADCYLIRRPYNQDKWHDNLFKMVSISGWYKSHVIDSVSEYEAIVEEARKYAKKMY